MPRKNQPGTVKRDSVSWSYIVSYPKPPVVKHALYHPGPHVLSICGNSPTWHSPVGWQSDPEVLKTLRECRRCADALEPDPEAKKVS